MNKILPTLVLLAMLGAGCPSPMAYSTQKPAAKMGFGKLPGLMAYGSLGTAEAISSRSAGAMAIAPTTAAMPLPAGNVTFNAVAGDMAVTTVGGGSAGVRIAPVDLKMVPPDERPMTQATVIYKLTGTVPEWAAEGDVLHVNRPTPDAGLVRSVGNSAGLPGQILSGIQTVQSIQASWRDNQSFTWNVDPVNGNLNWWKEIDWRVAQEQARPEKPPKVDQARVIAAANAFLDAHGLGAVKNQGAEIDNSPYVRALLDGTSDTSMPCLMKEEAVRMEATDTRIADPAISAVAPSAMIFPSPCGGWWPQQITVFYGTNREGLSVVDAGGWPNRASSINVDVMTYEVMGGNVMFTEQVERSAYPLISREEGMKRLEAGGRNQIWPWGYEGQNINVTISEVKLAWMRHDTWTEGRQQTYFLPALAAKGMVDRGLKDQPQPEEYYTVVPLVADSAFDLGEQGGGGVPMPLMMDAAVPVPPPHPEPEY